MIKFLVAALLIGLIAGYNIGIKSTEYKYVWEPERNGLTQLNNIMKNDKTERLAIVTITQQGIYSVQNLQQEKFRPFGGIMTQTGEVVMTSQTNGFAI